MNSKIRRAVCAVAAITGLAVFAQTATAQNFFGGGQGQQQGNWQGGGNGQGGYGGGYGGHHHYHHNGGNGFGGMVQQDNNISNREQWIQNRLNQGNLTPQQQSALQSRLTQLQGRQTQINGQLGTDLSARQAQLQSMLNAGNLSPQQQANIQNELSRIQSQQSALSSGTNPFAGQGGNGWGGHGYGHGGGRWNNGMGGPNGQNGQNSFRGLVNRDDRISQQEQWIQGQLNSGTLTPQQQQNLQNRLQQLQSRQATVNGGTNSFYNQNGSTP